MGSSISQPLLDGFSPNLQVLTPGPPITPPPPPPPKKKQPNKNAGSLHQQSVIAKDMSRATGKQQEAVFGTLSKMCRACSDFKTWAKENGININLCERTDCPIDKEELGRNTWAFLHTMAAYFPNEPTECEQKEMALFINLFSKFYPCKHCIDDLKLEVEHNPPKTKSQTDFSLWMCRLHNAVNKKLGKTEFDCSQVNERWRDGWKDGSCG